VQVQLSRASALELRNFLGSVTAVLARYADSDPEAKRLYRDLSAADESGDTSSTRMIYLSADDEANDVRSDLDVGGHRVVRYEDGLENCIRCSALLAEAGDYSAQLPAGSFAISERHRAAQRYILDHPGTSFLAALQQVEMAERT
jgi:hypothetical protein